MKYVKGPIATVVGVLLAVLLSACGVVEPNEPQFDAEARMSGDTVYYSLSVENPTAETVELRMGGCVRAQALRAYDLPDPGGLLRWDETAAPPEVPCFGDMPILPLPAGERFAFHSGFATVQQILGDSLPEGPYRLGVVPVFLQDFSHQEVSVGVFTLER